MTAAEGRMGGRNGNVGPGHLPEKLRPYFWDTDFDALDTQKNKLFIISGLYTKGGLAGVKWVDENYTDGDIMEAAGKRRDFTPVVANYLRKKYGLEKEEMAYYSLPEERFWR